MMSRAKRGGADAPARRPEASPPPRDARPGLASAYRLARAHRGDGELFTLLISDRLGSVAAAAGIRLGVHPSVITLVDGVVALIASAVVVAGAGQAAPLWAPGLLAFVCWQLAYVLDCADGQVARATGKTSDFGARVDVLVDFLVQSSIVCAIATVVERASDVPVALLVVFATTWFVDLITWVLSRADGNVGHSFTSGSGGIVGVVKLVRDYGLVVFVLSGWLAIHPRSLIVPVTAFTAVHVAFLLASIGREAWLSMTKGGRP
jgi:phosphatidylglycerophosphate synthase